MSARDGLAGLFVWAFLSLLAVSYAGSHATVALTAGTVGGLALGLWLSRVGSPRKPSPAGTGLRGLSSKHDLLVGLPLLVVLFGANYLPVTWTLPAILLLLLLLANRRFVRGGQLLATPLDLPAVLLLVMGLISQHALCSFAR